MRATWAKKRQGLMLAVLGILAVANVGCSNSANTSTHANATSTPRTSTAPPKTSAAASSGTGAGGLTWSPMAAVDPHGGGLVAVSCPSSSFCAAVDKAGNVVTYHGSSWSAASPVDPGGKGLESVSCPSSSFCAAADNAGNVLTYHGSVWSKPLPVGSDPTLGLSPVSCASPSDCVAVTHAGEFVTYNGATWTTKRYDLGSTPQAISCPSPSFCAEVLSGLPDSVVAIYNGTSSSQPTMVDPSGFLKSISCPSPSFCVAVGSPNTVSPDAHAFTYNGTAWGGPTLLNLHVAVGTLDTVSCASPSFCAAAGSRLLLTYDGTSWAKPTGLVDPSQMSFSALSCPTASFCVGVSPTGYAAIGHSS